MISALKGDGVDALRKALARRMAPSPWLYPEDQLSDAPLRLLAAEIAREKLYERLHDELPYQSTVETESRTNQKDGSARIEQTIYVARETKEDRHRRGGRTGVEQGHRPGGAPEIAEAAEQPVPLLS